MVSFQTPLPPNHLNAVPEIENNPSKKRKWEEMEPLRVKNHPVINPWMNVNPNARKTTSTNSSAIDLHLEIPLPSDWQRCLDIQSGAIHFYNTRTHKRTQRDPSIRDAKTPLAPTAKPTALVNLDLELNLAHGDHHNGENNNSASSKTGPTLSLFSPSPLPTADTDQQEMVAAACKRCHLLVMLCKSYPACPNCKFMHPPPDQSLPNFLKPRLSLLC